MGLDEQKEEREVLDSIFPGEITDITDISYRIAVALDIPDDGTDTSLENPVLLLNVTYTAAYPDVGPLLDITSPPDAPKHPQLDISIDKAHLLDTLQPVIEESLGMAMVFTLVTTLKEAAEELILDRQRQVEKAKEAESRKLEDEENRKFHGNLVTIERFLQWREKFLAEMAEKARREKEEEEMEDKRKRGGKSDEKKLTGRQLWEKGLIGKIDEDELEQEDSVAALEKLQVDA